MDKIDFVVTWVDGNDPEWLQERAKYMPNRPDNGNATNRFRDWGLMKYWFRGVEKFAPWVNHVYFVTCGHYPDWLNLDHPKLKFVKHSDYIPQENLPTYNSNVIELYMHHLPGLSERFVLFNDDMFIVNDVKTVDFFKDGMPCETVRLGQTFGVGTNDIFAYTIFNNIAVINKYFSKKTVQKKHWRKLLSPQFGPEVIRTVLLWPFGHFSGFLDTHLPTSHLKSTFCEVWEKEEQLMHECGTHRFRSRGDVTHWLMKNWRICQGQFVPRSINWGKSFNIGSGTEWLKAVSSGKYSVICLNDSDPDLDFERHQKELIEAFEVILPDKCSFEK